MTSSTAARLRIGEWCVDPTQGKISRPGKVVRVEARSMRLLMRLAQQPGEVVSIDELLDHAWAGTIVSQDSVYQAVASLRRLLGDDSKTPRYIATVPRLGYRMVAPVADWNLAPTSTVAWPAGRTVAAFLSRRGGAVLGVVSALLLLVLIGVLAHRQRAAEGHAKLPSAPTVVTTTVAVLPIRDMTPAMDQEVLADNLTEDLIDRLGRLSHVRTPPPRSSFAMKGHGLSASEAARSLGVDFVIDGSVRRSETSVRLVVRLVRARDGLVVSSETQERPIHDLAPALDSIALMVDRGIRAPPQS